MLVSALVVPAWLFAATVSASAASDKADADANVAPEVPKNEHRKDDFAACRNLDGEFAPFCLPRHGDVYAWDTTHYITWDPDYFPTANTSLRLIGFYTSEFPNITSADEAEHKNKPLPGPPAHDLGGEQAFTTDSISAAWGFYQWHLDKSLLNSKKLRSANITICMVYLAPDSPRSTWVQGPTVILKKAKKKTKVAPEKPKRPPSEEPVLVIALPIVMVVSAFIIFMLSCWNRNIRRIGLGNVMGKTGRKNTAGLLAKEAGLAKGKKGTGRGKDEESIRLMDRDGYSSGEESGWRQEVVGGRRRNGGGDGARSRKLD